MKTEIIKLGEDMSQMDITAPEVGVDIQIKEDKSVIWISVDGVCVLRICQIPTLYLNGLEQ